MDVSPVVIAAPPIFWPYLRVSVDKRGQSTSTDRQTDDLERDREQQGWRLGQAYTDQGVAASRYSDKVRGDWDRLMADLRGGQLDGGILGLWESSRGSRRVGEWVELLDELERHRCRIWVHTHRQTYDPANGRHRSTLIDDANKAEYSSYETRERVLGTFDRDLVKGKPHGDVAYGWTRRYDERTKALVAQEPEPTEAPIVLEIFRRIDAGHSLRAIKLDLEARGVKSRRRVINRRNEEPTEVGGIPLSEVVIRDIAMNPTHKGHRRGRKGDPRTYPGNWEPLVPVVLWERVNARLSNPDRLTHRDSQARHLMSMTAKCAVAGCAMTPSQRGGEPWHLRCHANHGIQVNEALLDEIALDLIVGYLSRPDVIEELTKDQGDNPELEKVQGELAAIQRQITELAAEVAALRMPARVAGPAATALLAEEERLLAREKALTVPSALAPFVGPEHEVRKRWKAAPLTAQREVARLLFSPALLGEMRVGPSDNGPWCRHESHERAMQTCTHRVLARLEFARD